MKAIRWSGLMTPGASNSKMASVKATTTDVISIDTKGRACAGTTLE